jgi:two-component system, chemotaxis family, sensor kinase Cph1
LTIQWLESGGPKVRAPDTEGYGTTVIRASLEQIGGRALFDWRTTGLHCSLSLPLDTKIKLRNVRCDSGRSATKPVFTLTSARKNVLLVEDESMVAMMVEQVLAEFGLRVVGPYGTLDDAIRAATDTPLDAAILDINLDGQSIYPVVDLLMSKGVPTAFISGYGAESVDRRYEHIPLVQKPIDRQVLLDLFNLVGEVDDADFRGANVRL